MLKIVETSAFRRDVKIAQKRGKSMQKLMDVVDSLRQSKSLAQKHKPHPLKGTWKPKWECHIEPDWLLVYEVRETEVVLVRMGSHSDLFG
jgi:mRNA interferase YafQ